MMQICSTIPHVTVLMAVYNNERFLREAVDSILSQTFTDFEFLIINDGSTDRSREIILTYNDPRIRLVDNAENIGLTKSLNKGLALARGELIARLDADDISHYSRLEKQVRFMSDNTDIALVGTQARIIDIDGKVLRAIADIRMQSAIAINWGLIFGNPFIHSSVLIRRRVIWELLGGYDETYRYNQDFELWSRLLADFRATNIPEPLIDYRSHSESIAGTRSAAVLASRQQNLLKNKAVQRKNVSRLLGSETLAEQWPQVWSSITANWLDNNPVDQDRVLDYIHQIFHAFVKLNPGAQYCLEIRRHLSATLLYVACYLIRKNRLLALKCFTSALYSYPGIALQDFARFVILFLVGEAGINGLRHTLVHVRSARAHIFKN